MRGDTAFRYELAHAEKVINGVITAVASVAECDPLDVPPLSTAIDPDALEALYRSEQMKRPSGDWHVAFQYNGYTVIVHTYGLLEVQSNEIEGSDGAGMNSDPKE